MEELYAEYGKLMVQKEILEGQINSVRAKMAEKLNKPKTEGNEPEEKAA